MFHIYGKRKFITVFAKARHVSVVSQINPAQAISISHFFDIDAPPKKQQIFTRTDRKRMAFSVRSKLTLYI